MPVPAKPAAPHWAPAKKKKASETVAPPKVPGATRNPMKMASSEHHSHQHAVSLKGVTTTLGELWMPKDRLYLAAGLLLSIVVFFSGLHCGFVFDDHLAIVNNADADARNPLANVFQDDFWGHNLHAVVSNRSYRPLVVLCFRLQHMLMGYRHSALFLHLVNYTVAYLNACLVFFLARVYALIVFNQRGTACAQVRVSQLYTLPALALALFIVHPVHVDAVTSIVGRCELFYCFFGLLAFFTCHHFLTTKGGARRRVPLLVLTMVLIVLCVLSKDSGIVFAALVIVHAATLLVIKATSKTAAGFLCAASAGLVSTYFAFRHSFIGSVDLRRSPMLRRTETPQLFVPPGLRNYWAIRWVIQMKNLELLFFPTSFSCEYSYNCIPTLSSPSDPRVVPFLVVTIAVLGCVAALAHFAWRRRSQVAGVLLLSLLWIAIPYAPVSHLFVHIGTFVAERCLYGPSIGAVLFLVFFFAAHTGDVGRHGPRSHRVRCIPLAVLLILWSCLSMSQNPVWNSDMSLFEAAITTCPNSGKAHSQLATALVERDNAISAESETLFKKAYELDNDLKEVLYFLAIDMWQNKHDLASAYQAARQCAGDPLSMGKCYPLMAQMRTSLYPEMKPYEIALDDMAIAKRNPDIASKYHEAANLVVRDDRDYCYAQSLFLAAMHYWTFDGLTWRSDNVGSMDKDSQASYCHTTARLAHVAEQCYTVQRPAQYAARNNSRARVFKHGRIHRTLSSIAGGVRACDTDWSKASVLTANTTVFETYPTQIGQFIPMTTATLDALVGIFDKAYANANAENKANAEVLVLEVALRRYCNAAQLSADTPVTRKMRQIAPHELKQQQMTFKTHSGEWLKHIKASVSAMSSLSPADSRTQALLDTFATCVPGLSEVS